MRKGDRQDVDITVKPIAEGDHQMCSIVTVDNAICLDFFAGQPKLEAVKKEANGEDLGDERGRGTAAGRARERPRSLVEGARGTKRGRIALVITHK